MDKNYTEFHKIIKNNKDEIDKLNIELNSLYKKRVDCLMDKDKRLSNKELTNIDNEIDRIKKEIEDKQSNINAARSIIIHDVLESK